MLRKISAWLLFLGAVAPLSAVADDTIARFKGGIGVIPVSNGVGTAATAEIVTRNLVRGVQPPGQIWVISDLNADVKADGSIKVRGRGLLLGGGNGVGGNANATVFATLFCENVEHSTPTIGTPPVGVALAPNGDFRIDDRLDPTPPNPCVSPVLLIRNAANRSWFAAGIPKLSDDD